MKFKIIKTTKSASGEYAECVLGHTSVGDADGIIQYLNDGEGKGFCMSLNDFISRMYRGSARDELKKYVGEEGNVRFIYNKHLVQLLLFVGLSANGHENDKTPFINAVYGCFPLCPPEYSKYYCKPFENICYDLNTVKAIDCVDIDRYLEKDTALAIKE